MKRNMSSTGKLIFAFCCIAGAAVSANNAQQHVPSLLQPSSFQNGESFNQNHARNWFASLNPNAFQQQQQQQQQQTSSRDLPYPQSMYTLDNRRTRANPQQYSPNPAYGDFYQPSQSPFTFGGGGGGGGGGNDWSSLYGQVLLAELLYNPIFQQSFHQQQVGGAQEFPFSGDKKTPPSQKPRPVVNTNRPRNPQRPTQNDNNWKPQPAPPRVTTPPSVFVPATSTAQPVRTKVQPKLASLKCETASNGEGCYAFVREKMRFPAAVEYCKKHGMYLASATENNIELLNRMVTEALSKNATSSSRPCWERITMLANVDGLRQMRYGTYAFTMGGGECATPDTADPNGGAFYEVCLKEFDCTLVDWNVANSFFCAKDDKFDAWCVEPLSSDEFFNYFVTCKPIPGTIAEFKYPPMCLPIDYGDQVQRYGEQVLKFKHVKEASIISLIILPQVGALPLCVPDANCGDPAYKQNQFGLCRTSKSPVEAPDLEQLWPRGTIDYRFSGWDSNSEKNVSYIKDIMNLIQNSSDACLKFREVKDGATPGAVVQISPSRSPNSCVMESVGRKSGMQIIGYGSACFEKPGLIMRPLLHQLGVPVENTRYDRDDYITVDLAKVNDDPHTKLQAAKQSIPGRLSLETPYDFDSVTHFPSFALAKQKGDNVFLAKDSKVKIGQRTHLSDGDKLKLRKLYGECIHQ